MPSQEVDIASFETAIVALDDDFEASALVVAYLKGLGIARVICLAETGGTAISCCASAPTR